MQILHVSGVKFGDTQLILPTAKFSSMQIFLAIIMVMISKALYVVLKDSYSPETYILIGTIILNT